MDHIFNSITSTLSKQPPEQAKCILTLYGVTEGTLQSLELSYKSSYMSWDVSMYNYFIMVTVVGVLKLGGGWSYTLLHSVVWEQAMGNVCGCGKKWNTFYF